MMSQSQFNSLLDQVKNLYRFPRSKSGSFYMLTNWPIVKAKGNKHYNKIPFQRLNLATKQDWSQNIHYLATKFGVSRYIIDDLATN